MNSVMIYTSKRGNRIIFDDWANDKGIDEEDFVWVEMCKHHHNIYKGILGNRFDDGGACGICSVLGCDREADYYVDFKANEVFEDEMEEE